MASRALVEILDNHGRVRSRERVVLDSANPRFTIGRSVAADVVLDDPHVAAVHAMVEIDAQGGMFLTDLRSINGVQVENRRLHGAEGVSLYDGCFSVGRTRLRVRTSTELLAPELAEDGEDGRAARNAPWLGLGGALLCLAFVAFTAWVAAPQDIASVIATALISFMVLAGTWIAAWGFVTRVMQGEWRWARHAATFFSAFAALMAIDWLFDVLWFALSLPAWPMREALLLIMIAALALHWHLRAAAGISVRRAAILALILPLLIGGSSYLLVARNQARNVNYIGIDPQLFPPAWRLRAGGKIEQYFNDAAHLRDEADRKRRAMPSEETEE